MSEQPGRGSATVVTEAEALAVDITAQSHVTIAEAMARPLPEGQRSVPVLAHGSMIVKYYAPRGVDEQTPHTRDELYVVAQGSGWFVNGDRRRRFGVGDVLFVPAGVVHRFEDFSDDFGVWVVFYGPEGGEAPPAPSQ